MKNGSEAGGGVVTENVAVVQLALGDVVPSGTNPRKKFDEGALAELARTIERHGVLQPLTVRKKDGEFVYEIIAGERRWRASKLAGRTHVPCIVKDMSDADVIEVQYIENLARQDLTALEEAEGFARLLAPAKGETAARYTVESLAEKLGKSRSHVFGRLRLARLVGPAREALEAGRIPHTIAGLVAQLPGKELQERFLEEVSDWDGEKGAVASFRTAQEILEKAFIRQLDARQPRWDLEVEGLFKGAVSCTNCPKRSANIETFEGKDKRPNVCTDVLCYDRKAATARDMVLTAAEKGGYKVIRMEQWERNYTLQGSYEKLAENCWNDSKNRTWAELLDAAEKKTGEKVEVQRAMVELKDYHEGIVLREMAPRAELQKVLTAAGVLKSERGAGLGGEKTPSQKKAEQERKIALETARRAMALLVEAVTRKMDATKEYEFHRLLCSAILNEEVQIYDAFERAFARRGLVPEERKGGYKDRKKPFVDHLDGLTGPGYRGLLVELLLGVRAYGDCNYIGSTEDKTHFQKACSAFGVKLDAIEKTVREEKAGDAKARQEQIGTTRETSRSAAGPTVKKKSGTRMERVPTKVVDAPKKRGTDWNQTLEDWVTAAKGPALVGLLTETVTAREREAVAKLLKVDLKAAVERAREEKKKPTKVEAPKVALVEAPKKRGRGRPPKSGTLGARPSEKKKARGDSRPTSGKKSGTRVEHVPTGKKRGPGRPRKLKQPELI